MTFCFSNTFSTHISLFLYLDSLSDLLSFYSLLLVVRLDICLLDRRHDLLDCLRSGFNEFVDDVDHLL